MLAFALVFFIVVKVSISAAFVTASIAWLVVSMTDGGRVARGFESRSGSPSTRL
jgi:hypothetical protein